MKRDKVVILGSTGSIGTQSIDVINSVGDKDIIGLACNGDIEKLYKQVIETGARYVCIFDTNKAIEFINRFSLDKKKCLQSNSKKIRSICKSDEIELEVELKDKKSVKVGLSVCENVISESGLEIRYRNKKKISKLRLYTGMNGLLKLASLKEADMIIISVVGMIGIRPTVEAIKAKKIICLANKESLVCAGDIIMPLAKKNKVEIRPIDSEHSAIWQCLQGEKYESINKIIITASGGPFYGKKLSELKKVRLEDALKHPNWSMGRKITIDSSTLVNKGLEVMEAHHLFQMPYDKIDVVVQKESLIHSMVEFKDGAVKAQLGVPSMRVPIEYAIYKENRKFINEKTINWKELSKISIGVPDLNTFKGLKLAYVAIKKGGLMPSVYNALNEVAVHKFLNNEIKYLDIVDIIERGMAIFEKRKLNKRKFTIDDVEKTMEFAYSIVSNNS